ncbi:MAG: Arm DNA-binding domain-containing protein, partial [Alphaproteobacteria bacterium]|nr:Arm DNA-binding domain-containing protein [Alphaproteobacteria bacterium]
MIDRSNSTFSRRLRAARPRDKGYEVRDDIVSGLGVSIQPTGTRTFFLARMARGKRRYARIGDADAMTVPEARREARSLIASYIEPARKDNGPRTPGYPMT